MSVFSNREITENYLQLTQIVQSLHNGSSFNHAKLPAEIIERIFRLALILNPRPESVYTVPPLFPHYPQIDPAYVIECLSDKETLFEIKDRNSISRKLWYATENFSLSEVRRLGQIKLSTLSENQGWVSTPLGIGFPSSWWEIAIVRDPSPLEEVQVHGEVASKQSHRPQIRSEGGRLLTWRSHYNHHELYDRKLCEGPEFGPDHEIWQYLQEGDRIGIMGCVEYPAWRFIGYRAVIHIWNLFDPVEFC